MRRVSPEDWNGLSRILGSRQDTRTAETTWQGYGITIEYVNEIAKKMYPGMVAQQIFPHREKKRGELTRWYLSAYED